MRVPTVGAVDLVIGSMMIGCASRSLSALREQAATTQAATMQAPPLWEGIKWPSGWTYGDDGRGWLFHGWSVVIPRVEKNYRELLVDCSSGGLIHDHALLSPFSVGHFGSGYMLPAIVLTVICNNRDGDVSPSQPWCGCELWQLWLLHAVVHVGWELVENSAAFLQLWDKCFGEASTDGVSHAPLVGDSVLNSVGDVICATCGYLLCVYVVYPLWRECAREADRADVCWWWWCAMAGAGVCIVYPWLHMYHGYLMCANVCKR